SAAIHVERLFLLLVQDHDDRSVPAPEGADHPEPIVRFFVVPPLPAAEHQQVQAAGRKKELMRRVHHLLPPEIPDMQGHVLFLAERAAPIADLDSFRGPLLWIELAGYKSLDQRRLADAARAHQNELRLVERARPLALREIVAKDFSRRSWLVE